MNTQAQKPDSRWPLFALGFRPFFWLGATAGALLPALWLHMLASPGSTAPYGNGSLWHLHEMLFGFAIAVIAGFLLTASRNWSGTPTPRGGMLAFLAILWLAGRLAPWLPGTTPWLSALVDLAFIPALAVGLVPALWHTNQSSNRFFLLLFGVMALTNGIFHAALIQGDTASAASAGKAMLYLVILTITWISGRVVPFFTQRAVPASTPRNPPWLRRSATVALIGLGMLDVVLPGHWLIAIIAFAAAGAHLARLSLWHHPGVWRIPILGVLHLAYGWMIIGMILTGLSALELFPMALTTHALAMGGVGSFVIGMMVRVSLGHTGRTLVTGLSILGAFGAVQLGSIARVFGPLIAPAQSLAWVNVGGALWLGGFVLFAIRFTPILFSRRPDGADG